MSGNNRGGHPQGPYSQGSGYYPYTTSYQQQQQQQQQQYGGAWQHAGGNAGWQPRPVSLQAQHYSHHYGPPVLYQPYGQPPRPYVNYHQQPGPVYHGGGMGPRPYHHQMPPRPYLTSKPAGQKRKRKKDIVPPVERMVEDARVREPVSEAERKEIEAWKAERRKHWPTEENIRRKKEESDDRSIKLMDVLDTQKRLGLIKKAGTKELIDSLAKAKSRPLAGQRRDNAKRVKKTEVCRVQPVVHRPTLLERLLEKDIRSYKAKLVQIFEFAHMNGYFESSGSELVFPVCKEEDGGEKQQPLVDITRVSSPSLASSSSSGHSSSSSDHDNDDDDEGA